MKLFFDARYIRTDFHDGISRYSTELAAALYARDNSITFLICNNAQKQFLPERAKTQLIHAPTSWKEPFTAFALNHYHPDVVATPLQTMGGFGRQFKLILNQQDLTYYAHSAPPNNLSLPVRLLWRLYHLSYIPGRLTLNAADMVATVSETSKREIEKVHLTKRPIIVVPNAARDLSPLLKKPIKQGSSSPKNLVFMGSLLPHKNVITLVRMMKFLPGRTLHLLSSGSAEYIAELKRAIPEGADVVFHGGVSDEVYVNLLADDAIMVSASQSEGFGLPLAEALQLGVPAVVSDIPAFHEVAGDGALFCTPTDPRAFANAIASLDDQAVREKQVARGRAHIATFSWDASAKTLLDSAESLLQK